MSICSCSPVFCGPTKLGCFPSCDRIHTDLIAEETGIYRIVYTRNGVQKVWQFAGVKGQTLSFENKFNEWGVSCFKIVTPSLCYLADEEGNCDFSIQIRPVFEPEEEMPTIHYEEKEIPAIACPIPDIYEQKKAVVPEIKKEENWHYEEKEEKKDKVERMPFEQPKNK